MKVIHVMADGTERDSLDGYVLPRTPETECVYRMAQEYVERLMDEKKNKTRLPGKNARNSVA